MQMDRIRACSMDIHKDNITVCILTLKGKKIQIFSRVIVGDNSASALNNLNFPQKRKNPQRLERQGFQKLVQCHILIAFPLVNLCAIHIPLNFFQFIEVC